MGTVAVAWISLLLAGVFEIGWPLGLKWAQEPNKQILGSVLAIISMAVSGLLLFFAQKAIPIGTAYAVWTGIGAAGTFFVGLWFFGDPATFGRLLGAGLIVAGVMTMKLAH